MKLILTIYECFGIPDLVITATFRRTWVVRLEDGKQWGDRHWGWCWLEYWRVVLLCTETQLWVWAVVELKPPGADSCAPSVNKTTRNITVSVHPFISNDVTKSFLSFRRWINLGQPDSPHNGLSTKWCTQGRCSYRHFQEKWVVISHSSWHMEHSGRECKWRP